MLGGLMVDATGAAAVRSKSLRMPSIDIYRGMVMFLMLAEVLHWSQLREFKEGFSPWIQGVFEWVSFHTSELFFFGRNIVSLLVCQTSCIRADVGVDVSARMLAQLDFDIPRYLSTQFGQVANQFHI
jgi:hypothetical protein